jgi:uncharacterized membrane protein
MRTFKLAFRIVCGGMITFYCSLLGGLFVWASVGVWAEERRDRRRAAHTGGW